MRRGCVAWGLLALAWGPAARAACPDVTPEALSRSRIEAEAAIEAVEPDRLETVARSLEADLVCVTRPLVPRDIAATFRVLGYAAFLDDREAAAIWFRAAKALDPDYVIPPVLFPDRHPLRRVHDGAVVPPGDPVALPPPADGQLWVDGAPATTAPAGRPYLLQIVADDGTVRQSAVGWPGDAVPVYAIEVPREARRGSLHVAVGGLLVQPEADAPIGLGGLALGGELPLGDRLRARLDAGTGWTPLPAERQVRWGLEGDEVGTPLAWMPWGTLGLGVALPLGGLELVPGVAAVAAVGHDGLLVGGAAQSRLRLPAGPVDVVVDLQGGWASGAWLGSAVGASLSL